MPETLREKIEKLPVSRISIQADSSFTQPFEFVRRDEVLAVLDDFVERPEKGDLFYWRERAEDAIEGRSQSPKEVMAQGILAITEAIESSHSTAKEQTRALVTISQTLGSIKDELKRVSRG